MIETITLREYITYKGNDYHSHRYVNRFGGSYINDEYDDHTKLHRKG